MPDDLSFVPRTPDLLRTFGKGDREKLRSYLLMLGAFLEGRSPATKISYRTSVRQFFEMFSWISPEDVTLAHAAAFKKRLLDRGLSGASVGTRLAALTSFFEFLCRPVSASGKPLITSNPFLSVPRHDIKPTPYAKAKPMEWMTLKKIVDHIPPTPVGLRDKAILLFLAYTSRRRMEVAGLRVKDLDLDSPVKTYTVKLKGGKVKRFALPSICYDAIRAYWIAAGRLGTLRPDDGVFTSTTHPLTRDLDHRAPLSPRMINEILARASIRAGIKPDSVHIHGIRHMVAHELNENGARLQDIQELLGHALPNTTQIYTQALGGTVPSFEKQLSAIRNRARDLADGV